MTYLSKVGEVLNGLAKNADIPAEALSKLQTKFESDEYFDKMKEAFGYGQETEER